MTITYRRLQATDSKKYRAIRLESLKLHPESFGSGYEQQKDMPKLMFQQALEQPTDERFVIGAFHGEELIGITGFIPFAKDSRSVFRKAGEVIQVYVRPAYRGRKVGLALMNAVVEEGFKIPGIDQIVLGVRQGNLRAIRVYEQAGFRTVDPGGTERAGDGDCEHVMVIGRED